MKNKYKEIIWPQTATTKTGIRRECFRFFSVALKHPLRPSVAKIFVAFLQ
jgi:hypothetical protein